MENIKNINWNIEKDTKLKEERDIAFEEVVFEINSKRILDIYNHPNTEKYPNQKILVVNIRNYIYLVPFVYESEDSIFLKTVIPSRKATKKYLGDHYEK